ncbi:MAG TPA: DNA-processing protein DprA [Burkholderiales bacterium]|nr:DNA-processing protein DprA [Burkholderiales bacterium]
MDRQIDTGWLALAQLSRVGARARIALLEQLGSPEAVFSTPGATLKTILAEQNPDGGMDIGAAVEALLRGPDTDSFAADLAWLSQDHHHLVRWTDADYPPLLREIADPPIALYVVGERAALSQPQLAIVGSRNASPAGRENAAAFARSLSAAGLTITSGLALGVDGAAHQGALDAGGKTVAACGTGLDRVYPARHRDLAHAIAKNGALISEFRIGSPPRPQHFPVRNRLISGLSFGVLVVEAALESGSLITARLALEHGREVFAVPGSIHSPLARGCHALIRQGAKLVETANDIIEELGALAQLTRHTASARGAPQRALSPQAERLLTCLGHDPATLDHLVERSGLTAHAVSSMLVTLELEGIVAAMPGGRFQRMP